MEVKLTPLLDYTGKPDFNARGRNHWFHAHHAKIYAWNRYPRPSPQLQIEIFSKKMPDSCAPIVLILNPDDAVLLARAILHEVSELTPKVPQRVS